MILALALAVAAAAPPREPTPAELAGAVRTCVAATSSTAVHEAILTQASWVRVTTTEEEAAKQIRSFGYPGLRIVLHVVKRPNEIKPGCVISSYFGQSSTQNISSNLSETFGPPKDVIGGLTTWQLPEHFILVIQSPRKSELKISVAYKLPGTK